MCVRDKAFPDCHRVWSVQIANDILSLFSESSVGRVIYRYTQRYNDVKTRLDFGARETQTEQEQKKKKRMKRYTDKHTARLRGKIVVYLLLGQRLEYEGSHF